MSDERFQTRQAAAILGVSRRTLMRWKAAGTARPSGRWFGASGPLQWTRADVRWTARQHGITDLAWPEVTT